MSSPGIVPQNVLLISENKLKNFTDIDPNVTSSVLLPFIAVCQQTKLEYIIGARYYKSLLNQVADNEDPVLPKMYFAILPVFLARLLKLPNWIKNGSLILID